eukprot:TRINITY_DN1108_c4_g1_i1.p1 TRINITY_DN1108_c4_g1~~TRINITY_DN1108_c4_g1_i1.p1  ORF type:complete len:426 (+),score=87.67 TRINITY_DN1108_c4_g1_i1:66-1343(+)
MDHLISSIVNELHCSLCLEIFEEPRTLDCQHNFCLECLRLLKNKYKQNYISCPICRTKTELFDMEIEELPISNCINNIVTTLKEHNYNEDMGSSVPTFNLDTKTVKKEFKYDFSATKKLIKDMKYPSTENICKGELNNNNDNNDPKKIVNINNSNEEKEFATINIDHVEAMEIFTNWAKSLWFAPRGFERIVNDMSIYIPIKYIPFYKLTLQVSTYYDASFCKPVKSNVNKPGQVSVMDYSSKKRKKYQHEKKYIVLLNGSDFNEMSEENSYAFNSYINSTIPKRIEKLFDKLYAKYVPTGTTEEINVSPSISRVDHLDWGLVYNETSIKKDIKIKEEEFLVNKIKRDFPNDIIIDMSTDCAFYVTNSSLIYIPTYLSTFFYEDNYYFFLINAQNGDIVVERDGIIGLGKSFHRVCDYFSNLWKF